MKMDTIGSRWLFVATLLASCTAETVSPKNFSSSTSDLQNEDGIHLSVSQGDDMIPISPVLPLTDTANSDIPPTGFSGMVFMGNVGNQAEIKSDQLVMVSCDDNGGYLNPWDVLDAAASQSVPAILFYSEYSDWCILEDYTNNYQWIYSTKSKGDAKKMLDAVQISDNDEIYATIGYPGSVRVINGTSSSAANSDGSGNDNNNPLGPSPTTAVAMIILYSITGLITALFLVIIITGAFRAHRHPERYGPRNVIGRPRQSRAKGLARALLDTLPIVKFNERDDPKPTDVELTGVTTDGATTRNTSETTTQTRQPNSESRDDQPHQTGQTDQPTDGGIAPATEPTQTGDPDNLGCSICTEDFESGQDQRVLPCDHRFHPECVDPWLLNVSGTCPLCRIDLRPETSRTSESGGDETTDGPALREGEFEPPPLGSQETAGERQRMSVRRSIVLGMMGIGRPDRMTREERVQALRQLRGQQLDRERREEQEAVVETAEEETRTRRRLRDVLGIWTRRAGQPTQIHTQGESARTEPDIRNGM